MFWVVEKAIEINRNTFIFIKFDALYKWSNLG